MKVFLEAYGCTQNMGEIERFRSSASTIPGVELAETPEESDICVIGTCIVIETTQLKMFKRMHELSEMGKTIAVTGCLPKVFREELAKRFPDSKAFDFTDIDGFSSWLMGLAEGGNAEIAGEPLTDKIEPSTEGNRNPKTAIIPISQGCLGSCTYCITRLARGELRSYEPEAVINRARELIALGKKEIFITAQDTAAYGRDIDESLPELIGRMTEMEPNDGIDYRLRIGMMNPDNTKAILPELIEMYREPRVFKFLHIPVQSGCDRILRKMGRRYGVEEFKNILNEIRKAHPDMMISTDIIVGFPSETYDEFKQSCDLINEIGPDILNVTRFSARPGTPAANMDEQVHGRINKEWSRELTHLRKEIGLEINNRYIGKRGRALITEFGANNKLIARLDNYKVVLIDRTRVLSIGQWVNVEVNDAQELYTIGRIV